MDGAGGQRPGGGETRPAPAAWKQEKLCGAADKDNGRGRGRALGSKAGDGSLRCGWELGGRPAPSSSGPGPSAEGHTGVGGGGHSGPTMELCVLAAEGRGRPQSLPWLPAGQKLGSPGGAGGKGCGRELQARVPQKMVAGGLNSWETPGCGGGDGRTREGQVLRTLGAWERVEETVVGPAVVGEGKSRHPGAGRDRGSAPVRCELNLGYPPLSTPPTISITMTSLARGSEAFLLPWQPVGASLETFFSHDGLAQ